MSLAVTIIAGDLPLPPRVEGDPYWRDAIALDVGVGGRTIGAVAIGAEREHTVWRGKRLRAGCASGEEHEPKSGAPQMPNDHRRRTLMTRKPIQIAALPETDDRAEKLFALCGDGTMGSHSGAWVGTRVEADS